jgi:hypothetical protein
VGAERGLEDNAVSKQSEGDERKKGKKRTSKLILTSSRVHSSKLPRVLSGRIFFAFFLSFGSGDPSMMICRSSSEKDMRPRLRPLKRPESMMSTTAKIRSNVMDPSTAAYSVEASGQSGSDMTK